MLKYQWTNGSSPQRTPRSQRPLNNVSQTLKKEEPTFHSASSVVDPCMMSTPSQNNCETKINMYKFSVNQISKYENLNCAKRFI